MYHFIWFHLYFIKLWYNSISRFSENHLNRYMLHTDRLYWPEETEIILRIEIIPSEKNITMCVLTDFLCFTGYENLHQFFTNISPAKRSAMVTSFLYKTNYLEFVDDFPYFNLLQLVAVVAIKTNLWCKKHPPFFYLIIAGAFILNTSIHLMLNLSVFIINNWQCMYFAIYIVFSVFFQYTQWEWADCLFYILLYCPETKRF